MVAHGLSMEKLQGGISHQGHLFRAMVLEQCVRGILGDLPAGFHQQPGGVQLLAVEVEGT